jgi:RpiB/LacA/LacB family sugar-phosphate isomerase
MIYIASDHAGFEVKNKVYSYLEELGHEVVDLGTDSQQSCHYPDFTKSLCEKIQSNPSCRGVLICGSGVGVSMTASRFSGIRAVLCHREDVAKLSREHNDSNVICLGARIVSLEENKRILDAWLKTKFAGGRHSLRLKLFNQLGESKVLKYFTSQLEAFLLISGLLITFLGSLLGRFNSPYFKGTYTLEDGFLEWNSVVFLISASVVSFNRFRTSKSSALIRATLFSFGLLFLFGAGEEISWGQRLFNVQSSEFFQQVNSQGETNLHNLTVNGVKVNKLIFGKILGLGLISYFIFLPVLYRKVEAVNGLIKKFGVPLPRNIHIYFFLAVALLAEVSGASKKGELTEFAGTLVFFLIFLKPLNEDSIS